MLASVVPVVVPTRYPAHHCLSPLSFGRIEVEPVQLQLMSADIREKDMTTHLWS